MLLNLFFYQCERWENGISVFGLFPFLFLWSVCSFFYFLGLLKMFSNFQWVALFSTLSLWYFKLQIFFQFDICLFTLLVVSFVMKVLFFFKCQFLINLFIFILIFGCVGSSFLCEGFLQLWQAGATLHHGARASHYRGLSCCGAQAPDAQAQ